MKIYRDEKGITLIEVLVSITLLSIVLLSVMGFFPQMGLMNSHNEDKSKAINIAKEILINWQESSDVKWFVKTNHVTGFTPTDPKVNYSNFSYDADYYYFETSKDIYDVHIKIKKTPDTSSKLSSVNYIVIQMLNKKTGNVVSETFGYVK
ncbi:type IV pilus modification PilV family protein [Neobacillus kokaensis]|uniref:Prepilin-type N-terminal cleavage/methylation domain-containing protein n=1 Tax=Neobacillus kokaensis TaxID=2759023 RepID=A0ABQ3MWZ0_9BACI|nr:prepilin-type N-terminal cleavage/methylation domain-containing protein [Neobacillus kokaensis]GHH97193.1 hypothetical protein AM1BK_07360 [Neobacillus kokaensis]